MGEPTPLLPRVALIQGAAALNLSLAADQVDRFERYAAELVDWNRRINLTAITDPLEIVHKHFLDSLSILSVCDLHMGERIIDVGSGAGFPALPIRIVRPDLHVTLLEATRKKCDFLRHMVEALALDRVTVVHARAEDVAHDPAQREQYATALARAVAGLATLSEYLLPFVRIGGQAIAQKAGAVETEVGAAGAAIEVLGGRLQRVTPATVPGVMESRAILLIEKIAPTPEKYPRRAGMPEKRPIR
ncbi:MAG TPA: 16S rRNA (guanine(527)-N(7))-methyltransferase RsmG [Anaerolineae bacterium]|nr:16S rRNA (guanine(527)-N(7))-methyltransferase RsmG [Anaerolineae bacterium]